VRRPPLAIFVSMLGAAVAAINSAPANAQPTPADGPWSGYAECTLSARGDYYQDDEKHIWRITPGAATPSGAFRVWPGKWTVDGDGARLVPATAGQTPALDGPSEIWVAAADMSAPISIWKLPGTDTIRIGSQHGVLVAQTGYTVKAGSGGPQATETTTQGSLQEWQFPTIDAPASSTSIVGSRPARTLPGVAWKQPPGVLTTETCSWNFQKTGATSTLPFNTRLRDGARPDLLTRFATKTGAAGAAAGTKAGVGSATAGAAGAAGGIRANEVTAGRPGRNGATQSAAPNAANESGLPATDRAPRDTGSPDTSGAAGADPPPSSDALAGNAARNPDSRLVRTSGNYRVWVTGFLCVTPTRDSVTDGLGDEIYGAAIVRRFSRNGVVIDSYSMTTREYGDKTDTQNWAQRIKAGSARAGGGIRQGDKIPTGATLTSTGTGSNNEFPWLLWEGPLTDKGEVVLLTLSLWESDDLDSTFVSWREQEMNLTASQLFDDAKVQNHITSGTGYAAVAIGGTPQASAAQLVASGLFLPYAVISNLLSGGADRPIGLRHIVGTDNVYFPNTVVVLTREIIESALSAPYAQSIQNPANPFEQIQIPSAGFLMIYFIDAADFSNIALGPGYYVMVLKIESAG